jgi:hypothetical protein
VYDHVSGVRLHLLGLVRLPTGEQVSANEWPESSAVWRYEQLNGGNRKRGLMAWARSLLTLAATVADQYADLLPPLSTEEFAALKADVKANGVLHPVILEELP